MPRESRKGIYRNCGKYQKLWEKNERGAKVDVKCDAERLLPNCHSQKPTIRHHSHTPRHQHPRATEAPHVFLGAMPLPKCTLSVLALQNPHSSHCASY